MSTVVKSYWDVLPIEIQVYIMKLADRCHHRDHLRMVHQTLKHYWDICRCGPFHVLCEIIFCEEYQIACGIREFLRSQNRVIYQYQICC